MRDEARRTVSERRGGRGGGHGGVDPGVGMFDSLL